MNSVISKCTYIYTFTKKKSHLIGHLDEESCSFGVFGLTLQHLSTQQSTALSQDHVSIRHTQRVKLQTDYKVYF